MKALILTLLCIVPREDVVTDYAHKQEVHHLYDDNGKLVFSQLICWERTPCRESERCFAWRLIKNEHMRPEYDHERGIWVTRFMDGEIHRRIESPLFTETWTQSCFEGDRELNDRAYWPKERRRELSKRPVLDVRTE